MKIWSIALLAGSMAIAATSTARADIEDFTGVWEYTQLRTAGVKRLDIAWDGKILRVRTLGACGAACNWGTVNALYFKGNRKRREEFVTFQQSAWQTENFMTLKPEGPNRMRLEFFRHIPNNPTGSFNLTYVMNKVPGAAPDLAKTDKSLVREDCIGFDTNLVRSNRFGGSWQVASSAVWLIETSDQNVTNRGVQVIKNYGINTQCSVGTEKATMHYYLTDGKAPSGPMPGEQCVTFKPKKLNVKKGKLLFRGEVIFDFQGNNGEAKRAARLIKKYSFTNACYLSRENPQLTYFRK